MKQTFLILNSESQHSHYFTRLMLHLLKKPLQTITPPKQQSYNVGYPTTAQHIRYNPIPGPGTYNPEKKKKPNKINFSGSERQPLVAKQNSDLGPGSFEAEKLHGTSVKIGTSVRPPLAVPSSAPNPGQYEYQSKIIETQGIKIKGSSFDPITKEIHSRPGPGTHDPVQKSTSPQYLIPKSQRYDFTKQKLGIPGPIYEIPLKPSTPAFKFGTCKR